MPRRCPPSRDRVAELLPGGRLALFEGRVQRIVEPAPARADADPNDRFRGLYISDAQVDQLLAGPGRSSDAGAMPSTGPARPDRGRGGRCRRRRATTSGCAGSRAVFGLDELDLELLLIALAPDLDARFERLYAYLNDDVSRRRATIGLALELAGRSAPRRAPSAAGSHRPARWSPADWSSSRSPSGRS